MNLSRVFGVAALIVGGALLYGCGTETASTEYSYQGLGSKWSASFTGGSNFEITYDAEPDGTADMTVSGTYVEYANKFRKLTVVSATGTGAPSAGGTAYGIEIPGFAFFLKPMGTDSEPIVMVRSGSCPSSDFVANWIIAKYQDTVNTPKTDSDGYGQATFTGTTATISQYEFGTGAAMADNTINLLGCSSGVQTFDDGGGGGTMYVTSSGGMLVNPGSGVIFASPIGSADVTSTDWGQTYSGLVFNDNLGSDKVFPAKVTLSGTGGTGAKLTDVENDTEDSSSVTFASLTAVSGTKGIFRGTVDGRPFNCVSSVVEGRRMLACNGAGGNASAGVYPSFFFLGVAR